MAKINENMKALEITKNAVNKIEDALEAIDAFVDILGCGEEEEKEQEKMVELPELAAILAIELRLPLNCVYTVLYNAFDFIKEHDVTVVIEEEDDDE